MRLRLIFSPTLIHTSIPINYNYYISTSVYKWIDTSSPDYAAFLHEKGFHIESTVKRFKHFCFSQLIIPNRKVSNGHIHILSPTIEWFISIPVEETLKHFALGLFEKKEFYIEREENRFFVERVEIIPEPTWTRCMKFRMLSPLTVSVPEERSGKLIPHYLRPDDPRLKDALRSNILNKYASLYGSQLQDREFRCSLDERFIAQRGGPQKISKLITIKQGHKSETKVRGFMCPLTIEGNPQLIKLAYESGLGEKGSLGFGMVEVV